MSDEPEETPSWLANKDTVKYPAKRPAPPTRPVNTEVVKAALEESGATVVIKSQDNPEVVEINCADDEEERDALEFDTLQAWANGRVITQAGRIVRDRFVVEFVKDFNGIEAATRCGSSNPVNLWTKLRRCPYTQRKLSQMMNKWEAEAFVTRNKIIATLWREANDFVHGNASSRVAATSKLAKIMGMDDTTINVNFGMQQEFVETPLTRQEFDEMRLAFDEEY